MGVRVFGLPHCDTCRKARRWLERAAIEHAFVDYRADPVPGEVLHDWADRLGGWERLVNKSGTTWRTLLSQRKNPASEPEWLLLLKEHPTLIRRPVLVREDGAVTVGFSAAGYQQLFTLTSAQAP
jgi:Spx/MgsR family transcriptional regulator